MISQILVDASILANMLAMLSERISQYESKCKQLFAECDKAFDEYNHMRRECENMIDSGDTFCDTMADRFAEHLERIDNAKTELVKCIGAREFLDEMLLYLKLCAAEYAQK